MERVALIAAPLRLNWGAGKKGMPDNFTELLGRGCTLQQLCSPRPRAGCAACCMLFREAAADCRLLLTDDVAHNKGGQVVHEIAVLLA